MAHKLIDITEKPYLKSERPDIPISATVDVHTRIVEGDKERIQVFNGVVIARRGRGVNETFTVRRIVANQGVERVFMLHSPRVVKIEVRRHGKVRRAKLYYLRDRVGKARRLREKRRASSKTSTAGRAASDNATEKGVGDDTTEKMEVAGQTA